MTAKAALRGYIHGSIPCQNNDVDTRTHPQVLDAAGKVIPYMPSDVAFGDVTTLGAAQFEISTSKSLGGPSQAVGWRGVSLSQIG